jgi:hypothetical protein
LTEALLLNGVLPLAVLRASHPHPDPKDSVTLTPLLGFVLVTEMLCAVGAALPIW